MNIFTVNQVNQVYVMKSDSTVVDSLDASHQITKSNNLGSVGLGKTPDGKAIYFKHLGVAGVNRSDLINLDCLMDVKATPASKMARKLYAVKLTLNSEALDSGKPIAGQDYILTVKFSNALSLSPDNQYWKNAVVHATASTTASDFYKKMALSLAKNMAREEVKLISIFLTTSNSSVEVTADTAASSLSGTYTGIIIKEAEQDWILGLKQQRALIFNIEPSTIDKVTNGVKDEIYWGDTIDSEGRKTTGGVYPETELDAANAISTTTVPNGKLMADYEYFYMGERADLYRMSGWPNYVPTQYMVDPTLEYDTIGIHFAYVGANHAVQKSEKDITFLIPRAGTDTTASAVGAKAASLLAAITAAIDAPYGASQVYTKEDVYTKDEADAAFEPKSD